MSTKEANNFKYLLQKQKHYVLFLYAEQALQMLKPQENAVGQTQHLMFSVINIHIITMKIIYEWTTRKDIIVL
jgi:hypothetical protein